MLIAAKQQFRYLPRLASKPGREASHTREVTWQSTAIRPVSLAPSERTRSSLVIVDIADKLRASVQSLL